MTIRNIRNMLEQSPICGQVKCDVQFLDNKFVYITFMRQARHSSVLLFTHFTKCTKGTRRRVIYIRLRIVRMAV